MTTFLTARDLISTAFNTGWSARTPVAWNNVQFTPPDTSAWVRFSVTNNFSSQQNLGSAPNRSFRRQGIVFVQVFVPLDDETGLENGDILAEAALSIFEGKQVSGIWFRNGSIAEVGPTDRWFQYNVTFDFQYDEIK